eukprot:Platyproteum_vivax@DN10343_c0_g1_i1.p1
MSTSINENEGTLSNFSLKPVGGLARDHREEEVRHYPTYVGPTQNDSLAARIMADHNSPLLNLDPKAAPGTIVNIKNSKAKFNARLNADEKQHSQSHSPTHRVTLEEKHHSPEEWGEARASSANPKRRRHKPQKDHKGPQPKRNEGGKEGKLGDGSR